ncbi:leucine-rich repeat domain-containing protein [Candidatus Dependentiae bacterium]|nr:MAG: leucine-rich repeat domain-containing protein [Candidatus Dependentiae bacterium]
MSSLPENIFNKLHKLQMLDLHYNQLTTLPEGIFNELHKLQWLYLSNNQLSDTAKQSIREALPNLREALPNVGIRF